MTKKGKGWCEREWKGVLGKIQLRWNEKGARCVFCAFVLGRKKINEKWKILAEVQTGDMERQQRLGVILCSSGTLTSHLSHLTLKRK